MTNSLPHDACGRPIREDHDYMLRYPYEFIIVRVAHITPRGMPVLRRLWPPSGTVIRSSDSQHGLFKAMAHDLTPIDPAVLGRMTRELINYCEEYAESLAPVPGTETEEIDHEEL